MPKKSARHLHADTHAHTKPHTQPRWHARLRARAHAPARKHARTHTRTHAHARTHASTHTHTLTHIHKRAHALTRAVGVGHLQMRVRWRRRGRFLRQVYRRGGRYMRPHLPTTDRAGTGAPKLRKGRWGASPSAGVRTHLSDRSEGNRRRRRPMRRGHSATSTLSPRRARTRCHLSTSAGIENHA